MSEIDEHPDETAAAVAAGRDDPAARARSWLLGSTVATLCTTSCQRGIEGYPTGSVVPFALTAEGQPIVLVAEMAAHTANLRRDPRAALFVRDGEAHADPQAGWRLAVMGRLERLVGGDPREGDAVVAAELLDELDARYLERVPTASRYHETHDFAYWRMTAPVRARYIAGFGRICWLDGDALLRDPGGEGLGEARTGAIAHMNEDHASSMVEMCAGLHGFTPESAEMVGLDRTGFLVRTRGPERLVHFSFGREIGAAELRRAVIDVLARARQAR